MGVYKCEYTPIWILNMMSKCLRLGKKIKLKFYGVLKKHYLSAIKKPSAFVSSAFFLA